MRPPPAVVKHFQVSLRHSPQKGYDVACAVCKNCGKKYPTIDVKSQPRTCWKAATMHAGRCCKQTGHKDCMMENVSIDTQGHAETSRGVVKSHHAMAQSSRPRLVFSSTRRVLQQTTAASSMLTNVSEQQRQGVPNSTYNTPVTQNLSFSMPQVDDFHEQFTPTHEEQSPLTAPRLLDEFQQHTHEQYTSLSRAVVSSTQQYAAQTASPHTTGTPAPSVCTYHSTRAEHSSLLHGMCMSREQQEQLVGPCFDDSSSDSSSTDHDEPLRTRPTARHYTHVLSQPVDPAHRPQGINTAQFISLMAWWQCRHNTSNTAMDDMVKIINNVMLRTQADTACRLVDHNVPPSRYLISKIIGQKDQQSIQYHICACFKYAWPPFKGKYNKLVNQRCPKCDGPRVVKTKEASQGKETQYRPMHCFWYFGVQEGIKTYLFGNKDWASYRATDGARQNTFYTSKLADQLREHPACGHAIDDRNNSVYVIGIDWFQPFTYKQHSVGVIFLKCLDFEDRFQGVGTNIFPLMILEGPKEPQSIQVHIGYIAQEFMQFGPQSNGFEVVNSNTQETFMHKIILGGVLGDTPARQKVAGLTGHSAKMGCPYCVSNATRVVGYTASYWCGFQDPVPVNIQQVIRFDQIQSQPYMTTAKIGDPRVHCNHTLIQLKAQLAEQYKLTQGTSKIPSPNPFGAHMQCMFTRVVPYFDLELMLVIPASHGLLRGVGYDLWQYIFSPAAYKPKPPNTRETPAGYGKHANKKRRRQPIVRHISNAARKRLQDWEARCPPDYNTRVWYNGPIITPQDKKLIAARGQQVRRNCDLPTPYKCIVSGDGKLGTMDEYLNFFDCYAPLVLRDVQLGNAGFTQCVGNLMRAIAWFLRPPSRDDMAQYDMLLEQYHQHILDYGSFIENHGLPASLLKVSLHIMACQLKQQCKARGHLAADNELFIERAIQSIKNKLRARSTQFPEKVLSNTLLLKLASTNFRMLHECATFQELTGRGMEREIYEVDMGTSISDDKPEREYFTGRGSWTGQRCHRLSGQGHKLKFMEKLSEYDKAQLMHALHAHLLQQRNTRRIDLSSAMIEDFKQHALLEHRIRLHTGAFLSHGEMVLSVAHGRERVNESCWTLARIKLRNGGSAEHVCVVKIIRFVFCRLSGGQNVNWSPPPYRAAVGIIYHTEEQHTPYGVLYKVDLNRKLTHAGQAAISLDLSGKKSSSRDIVSILNLDYVSRKVASVPDDVEPDRYWWFATHSARSGFGFWDED